MQSLFMVIDNGGTNTKIVIFDLNGKQIDDISFSTPRLEPQKDFREVDMDVVWFNIKKTIKRILEKNNITPEQIVGITTIGHGKGLYLLDSKGTPVRNGILSTDSRAKEIIKELTTDNLLPTLQPILVSQAPTLLRWLKLNEQISYQKIEHILSAKDYIRYKLTGKINTDYTDASSNNVMDIEEKKYDPEIFDYFQIDEMYNKMPSILNSTDVSGYITKKAAEETGLKEGTPVMTGMFDIDASALATNVIDPDYISVTAGTWSINEFLAKKPVEKNNDILNSIFVNKEYYLIESSSATSAGNLDIILKTFLDSEIVKDNNVRDNIYEIINKTLMDTDSKTTDIIYLPFLYGSNVTPSAKGSFIGLSSDVNFTKIIRAVFEGVAYSHKYHYDKLIEEKYTPTKGIRLAGGIINSPIWVQILADVLNTKIEIVEAKEVGALGGAIALSVSLGYSDNLSEAGAKMSKIKNEFLPNPYEAERYEKKYKKYKKIIDALNNVW